MAKMISARETAKRWNIAEQLVTRYCREGRIAGVEKEGRSWLIPEDAVKPVDIALYHSPQQSQFRKLSTQTTPMH